jgi:hypothetical protein
MTNIDKSKFTDLFIGLFKRMNKPIIIVRSETQALHLMSW